MQHDVAHLLEDAFARVVAGQREPAPGGLTTAPLFERSPAPALRVAAGLPAQPSPAPPPSGALEWSETAPPHPRRVAVRNPHRAAIVVDAGARLDGGMTARAVPLTVVLGAGERRTLAVEPIAPRWWDDGPLREAGRLPPAEHALVLQAHLGASAAGSCARNLLAGGLSVAGADDLRAAAAGWTVWDGDNLLSALLVHPRGRGRQRPTGPRATGVAVRVTDALRSARVRAHVRMPAGDLLEVSLVPADLGLVDHLVDPGRRTHPASPRSLGRAAPSAPEEPA